MTKLFKANYSNISLQQSNLATPTTN